MGHIVITINISLVVGWDSSVGIVTERGMHGPGTESWLGTRLPTPVQTVPVAHPLSVSPGSIASGM